MIVEKHLIGQSVIVPYMKDTDSDILGLGFLITSSLMWVSNRRQNDTLFTMKAIEMKVCKDVYGVRLHLLTRYCKKN